MKSANDKALFVPLMKRYFDEFASGTKTFEYRINGPRWNERTCTKGRKAIIANGYGWPRLSAHVHDVTILPANSHLIPEAVRQLFGYDKEIIRIHFKSIKQLERT